MDYKRIPPSAAKAGRRERRQAACPGRSAGRSAATTAFGRQAGEPPDPVGRQADDGDDADHVTDYFNDSQRQAINEPIMASITYGLDVFMSNVLIYDMGGGA
eukprot:14960472-Heterocapsa_arctica.AAC.1